MSVWPVRRLDPVYACLKHFDVLLSCWVHNMKVDAESGILFL
jgi:hypothetical protein